MENDTLTVQDSIVSRTTILSLRDLIEGTLEVPPVVLANLSEHEHYALHIVQPGTRLTNAECSQRVALDDGTATGIDWPLGATGNVPVIVSTSRGGGCRIRVDVPAI
jgi:hypothetical protein